MYTFTNVTSQQLRHSVELLDAALKRHHGAPNVTGPLISVTYTVGHKKRATFIFTITLANVDRFQ